MLIEKSIEELPMRWSLQESRCIADPITRSQEIMQQTEALLQKWKHPDPYRPPTAPGGSKYERNIPAPILDREFYFAAMLFL